MRYRPKHLLEYAALRGVAGLLNALPYRAALLVAWGIAAIGFVCARPLVREATRRIRLVLGPAVSPARARRIAWISWRNTAFSGVEMLRVRRLTPAWLARVADSQDALRILTAHVRTGRGAILALPHMGNWEMAAVISHQHGIPIFSIAATQRNPLVNDYLNALRRAPGIDTLARGAGTMKQVIRRLRSGGVLAILPDVRVRQEGVRVPFLGDEANVGPGMALFARHADCPIFPCHVTRVGWARQIHYVAPPILPDPSLAKADDVARMTRQVLAFIEARIREVPEQWFWFNRRWILDPIDADSTSAPPTPGDA